MQNKNNGAKETDITWALVGVLVMMMAGAIVSLSNQFLQTKTSADTKAAGPNKTVLPNGKQQTQKSNAAASADDYCRSKNPLGIDIPSSSFSNVYSKSNDLCLPPGPAYRDTVIRCGLASLGYCIRKGDIATLGTSLCVTKLRMASSNLVGLSCEMGTNCPSGKVDSHQTCGYMNGNDLVNGTCCGIQPTPTPVATYNLEDCGSQHYNCKAMFGTGISVDSGDGRIGDTTLSLKNTYSTSTKVFTPVCGVAAGETNYNNAKCFLKASSGATCDGKQFSYPGYKSPTKVVLNTCFVSVAGALGDTGGDSDSLTGTKAKVCSVVSVGIGGKTSCRSKMTQ